MMHQPRIAVICLAIVAACSSIPSAKSTIAGGPLQSDTWVGRFAGTTAAGLRGDVRVAPGSRSGVMRVEFDLHSVAPMVRLPWSVRTGRCGESGAAELTAAVPHIEARPDRTASLKTEIRLGLEAGRDYHVAIGASPHQPTEIIACGLLTFVP